MKLSLVQRSLSWINSLNDSVPIHAAVKRPGLSASDIMALRRLADY
ncbi:MAG: hypothetical protein HW388_250 [Dehalococcoidia bacterium]|nr:hypothetical protein [Dehalococcoidia bacterium]